MRHGIVRRTVLGLAVLVVITSPARAGSPNPELPSGCGIDVGLLVDTSSSITEAGGQNPGLVRTATTELVRTLADTPSTVSAWRFAGEPEVVTRRLDLGDPVEAEVAVAALGNLDFGEGLISQGTNWDAALRAVENVALDVVVLITDGSPTAVGRVFDYHSRAPEATFDFDPSALRAAVRIADRIKAKGTRIVAVGVGDVRREGLEAISGPEEGKDWLVGEFTTLRASLRTVATALCGNGILTRVLVDGVEQRDPDVAVTPIGGGRRRSGAVLRAVPPGTYAVTPARPPGAYLSAVECDRDGKAAALPVRYRRGSVEITIGERELGSCTFAHTSSALIDSARVRGAGPITTDDSSSCHGVPFVDAAALAGGFVALLLASLQLAAGGASTRRRLAGAGAAAAVLAVGAGGVSFIVGGAVCGWASARLGLLAVVLAAVAHLVRRLLRHRPVPSVLRHEDRRRRSIVTGLLRHVRSEGERAAVAANPDQARARLTIALLGTALLTSAAAGLTGASIPWVAVAGAIGVLGAAVVFRVGTDGPAGPVTRAARLVVVILVPGAIVVAGLLAPWARNSADRRLIVIDGREIENAGDALLGIERFEAAVTARAGGLLGARTPCYFVRQDDGELADRVVCGPVRRPDDEASAWSRYDLALLARGGQGAYVHVERASRRPEPSPPAGLVRPDLARAVAPPPLSGVVTKARLPSPRAAPGLVAWSGRHAPVRPVATRTVDFGAEATVGVRLAWIDQVDLDGEPREAAVGERLVAVDVDRSSAAAAAAVRVVDGGRRLDVPAADRSSGKTLVVSLRHPNRAEVRVGLQGVEVSLAVPTLEQSRGALQTKLSAPVSLDTTVERAEVPVAAQDPVTGRPERALLFAWALHEAQLTTRHPRLGWADSGKTWLVVKVDDLGVPCPRQRPEVRCEIDLPASFSVRDIHGHVHPSVSHSRAHPSAIQGKVDVVFAVPTSVSEPTLVLQPTFQWEAKDMEAERVVFPRREVPIRLVGLSGDQAIAEAIVVDQGDLPGGWSAKPFARPAGVDESQARLERCLGREGMRARETARARSQDFHDRQSDGRQVSAAVSLQLRPEEAAADLDALRGDRAVDCHRAEFEPVLAEEFAATGQRPPRVRFEERVLAGVSAPCVAYRIVVVPADAEVPAFHQDFVFVVDGRVMIEFSARDIRVPVPDDIQVKVIEAMLARVPDIERGLRGSS